jgi:hypothetical protein
LAAKPQVISTVLSVLLIGLSAWHFPTGPGDPEDFLCRSAAARTSIVNMLNGGNTLYVMAVKTQGGDGPVGTWAPQKTPPTQSMLDDMYRVHAPLKGNDKSDLSNADSIKSGTTRYLRKNSGNTKMLVYSETCTSSPYPGVTVFRREPSARPG